MPSCSFQGWKSALLSIPCFEVPSKTFAYLSTCKRRWSLTPPSTGGVHFHEGMRRKNKSLQNERKQSRTLCLPELGLVLCCRLHWALQEGLEFSRLRLIKINPKVNGKVNAKRLPTHHSTPAVSRKVHSGVPKLRKDTWAPEVQPWLVPIAALCRAASRKGKGQAAPGQGWGPGGWFNLHGALVWMEGAPEGGWARWAKLQGHRGSLKEPKWPQGWSSTGPGGRRKGARGGS